MGDKASAHSTSSELRRSGAFMDSFLFGGKAVDQVMLLACRCHATEALKEAWKIRKARSARQVGTRGGASEPLRTDVLASSARVHESDPNASPLSALSQRYRLPLLLSLANNRSTCCYLASPTHAQPCLASSDSRLSEQELHASPHPPHMPTQHAASKAWLLWLAPSHLTNSSASGVQHSISELSWCSFKHRSHADAPFWLA